MVFNHFDRDIRDSDGGVSIVVGPQIIYFMSGFSTINQPFRGTSMSGNVHFNFQHGFLVSKLLDGLYMVRYLILFMTMEDPI